MDCNLPVRVKRYNTGSLLLAALVRCLSFICSCFTLSRALPTQLSVTVLSVHGAGAALWSPGAVWSVVQNTGWELSTGNNKNIPLGAVQSLEKCSRLSPLMLLILRAAPQLGVSIPVSPHVWHLSSESGSLVEFEMWKRSLWFGAGHGSVTVSLTEIQVGRIFKGPW